ncbi:MAG TPA: hypothetical protein V6D48_08170 [Oculatellaceae cyanobacterium]
MSVKLPDRVRRYGYTLDYVYGYRSDYRTNEKMYPNFPNTRPPTQQVVDLKLARDLKAYAQSWLQVMNLPR